MKKKKKVTNNYISNEEMLEELQKSQVDGDGVCTERLGEIFLLMTRGIAKKPNFVNYSFIEDMIAEALINCLKAVQRKKFDPEKSNNAFSYFTKIIFRRFINYISAFKKKSQKMEKWKDQQFEKLWIESGLSFDPKMVRDYKTETISTATEEPKKSS